MCTARGATCSYCGRINHFETVCMQKNRTQQRQQQPQYQPQRYVRTTTIENPQYQQMHSNEEIGHI